jgi:uncharacterized protein (DUF1015 family)
LRVKDEKEMMDRLRAHPVHAFALVLAHGGGIHLLSANEAALSVLRATMAPPLAELDVTLLHTLVLKNILGMTEEAQEKKLNLLYEKDSRRALDAVKNGDAQAAFILNPTRIEQVKAVASAGLFMPQKSTFFFPKLLSGLVLYSFDEIP